MKESLTNVVSFPSRIFSQQESKRSHNSLSNCCCSLIVTHTVCRQPYATFIHSIFHTQIQKRHGLLYRPMLSFIIFIKDAFFFPIFHKEVARWASGHWSSANGRKFELPHARYLIHHITWCVVVKRHSVRNSRRGKVLRYFVYYIPVKNRQFQI